MLAIANGERVAARSVAGSILKELLSIAIMYQLKLFTISEYAFSLEGSSIASQQSVHKVLRFRRVTLNGVKLHFELWISEKLCGKTARRS